MPGSLTEIARPATAVGASLLAMVSLSFGRYGIPLLGESDLNREQANCNAPCWFANWQFGSGLE